MVNGASVKTTLFWASSHVETLPRNLNVPLSREGSHTGNEKVAPAFTGDVCIALVMGEEREATEEKRCIFSHKSLQEEEHWHCRHTGGCTWTV